MRWALVAVWFIASNTSHAETGDEAPVSEETPAETQADTSDDASTPDASGDKSRAQTSVTQVFENGMYRFCHDPDYRLHPDDRYLCDVALDAEAVCPEFRGACGRPLRRTDEFWSGGSYARRTTLPELESLGIDASRLHVLIQRFVWPFLAVLLLVMTSVITRNIVIWLRSSKQREQPATEPAERAARQQARNEEHEIDAERLLARAETSAQSGEYERAMTDAYWSLLRCLDKLGRIRVQASCTNGDYVRELARYPDEQRRVRQAARVLERVQFGKAGADRDSFQRIWDQAQAVVKRGLLPLLLLMASFVPSACGERRSDAFERAWSGAPGGLLALMQLLEARDVDTRWRVRSINEIGDEVGTVIVLDASLEASEWDVLFDWVKGGGSLLVAGGANPVEGLLGVRRAEQRCRGGLTLHPDYQGPDLFEHAELRVPNTDVFEWSEQAALPVLECDGKPYLVMTGLGDGSLAVLPSPELLTNAALAAADNAYVMLGLLSQPGTTVEFVGTWTGSGADSPFEAAEHADLEPWLVQLLLLFVVFYLWQGLPFAKLREISLRPRRAFVEHVRALATQYRRARATRYALAAYTPWAIERLRERAQLGRGAGLLALAHAIAARTGRAEVDVVRVLVDATHSHEDPDAKGAHHLETMKSLIELVAESGGRR